MQVDTNSIEQTVKTIRERLIERFIAAREQVGDGWRDKLGEVNQFFNTRPGGNWMNAASAAVSNSRRISDDRLETVVRALEEVAGIPNPPIV